MQLLTETTILRTAVPHAACIFDPRIVSQLACPACFGDLRREDAHLVCAGCRRAYPIVDGIPVLIVERAEIGGHTGSELKKA